MTGTELPGPGQPTDSGAVALQAGRLDESISGRPPEPAAGPRPRRASWLERSVLSVMHAVLAFFLAGALAAPFGLLSYVRPLGAIGVVLGGTLLAALHPWAIPGRFGRRWRADLGLRSLAPRTLPWLLGAVLAFLGYQFISPALLARLTSASQPLMPPYGDAAEPLGWLVMPLRVALLMPIAEEYAFRGYLQHKLGRLLGRGLGLVVTSCVFALIHGSLALLPGFVFAGLVFGCALLAFRSIWAAVLLHAVANACSATVGIPEPFRAFGGGYWPWLLTPAFACAALLLIYGGYRARLADGRRRRALLAVRRGPDRVPQPA